MVEDKILTTKQVSELIGVPVGTLRYWRHCNTGPASFSLGRRTVYRSSVLSRWIADQESASIRGGDAA